MLGKGGISVSQTSIFTLFSIISNTYICSAKIRDSFVILKGIIGKLLQQMLIVFNNFEFY